MHGNTEIFTTHHGTAKEGWQGHHNWLQLQDLQTGIGNSLIKHSTALLTCRSCTATEPKTHTLEPSEICEYISCDDQPPTNKFKVDQVCAESFEFAQQVTTQHLIMEV